MQPPPDICCMRVGEAEAALGESGIALGDVMVTAPPRERRLLRGRFWEGEGVDEGDGEGDGGAYCYRVIRWSLRGGADAGTQPMERPGSARVADVVVARVPDTIRCD